MAAPIEARLSLSLSLSLSLLEPTGALLTGAQLGQQEAAAAAALVAPASERVIQHLGRPEIGGPSGRAADRAERAGGRAAREERPFPRAVRLNLG